MKKVLIAASIVLASIAPFTLVLPANVFNGKTGSDIDAGPGNQNSPAGAEPLEILFIGNSYTYTNGGFGGMIGDLAESVGFARPFVNAQVEGGITLTGHTVRPETLGMMGSRNWDYIVLQEDDIGPTRHGSYPRRIEDFMNASRTLNTRVQNNNASFGWSTQVVFLETWAREPGANLKQPTVPAYPDVFDDPNEMQGELRENNNRIARELGATVAPCGSAWENAFDVTPYPTLTLHAEDGSHPNDRGSYLTGLVLFKTLYGVEDTTGLAHENLAFGRVTVSEEDAAFLQSIANISPFALLDIQIDPAASTTTINWSSVTGKEYAVYCSDGPMSETMTWTLAEDNIPASGTGANTWIDDGTFTGSAPDTVPHRYYKVKVYIVP